MKIITQYSKGRLKIKASKSSTNPIINYGQTKSSIFRKNDIRTNR